jgi:hypothetical protein
MQPHPIAERVVATDRNHVLNAQPGEILQHFRREVILLLIELALEVIRNAALADFAGIGARRV